MEPSELWLEELWLEFNVHGHCGLCGNYGVVDTRGVVHTAARFQCGVRAFCVCANGRALKRAGADLDAWPSCPRTTYVSAANRKMESGVKMESGKKYHADLSFGMLERTANNATAALILDNLGFPGATVTGAGASRHATWTWDRPTADVDLPRCVVMVWEAPGEPTNRGEP